QQLARQIPQGLQRGLEAQQRRLERAALRLELLDPRHALQRGYALLTDAQGQAVTRVAQARPGDALRASLSDGDIDLTVIHPRLL
ncbi:MAG: exodeoxyribonuclease VII large subunit, partial [Comamonas sp.]